MGEISRGGMGVIYRARHRRLDNEVALKVILGGDASEEQLIRFEREAQTLAQLKHPNIVRVSDFGDEAGTPFFAMELIPGRELKDHVDRQKKRKTLPPFEWTVKMLEPIAAALVACHEKGVVHRDLKPHNIMVEAKTRRPVLVDFGLARPEAQRPEVSQSAGAAPSGNPDGSAELTQAGATMGTPAYMAPEQADAETYGPVGEKADVWGFGATLFYCLTGSAPYSGETALNVYKKLLTEDPRDVAVLNPETPRSLAALCRRCLTKAPAERPTMSEVRDVLAFELSRKERRRRRLLLLGLSLPSLVALGVLAWWLLLAKPELRSLEPVPRWTQDEVLLLAGVASPGANVVISERSREEWDPVDTVQVGDDGVFSWERRLQLGDNQFQLRVTESEGEPVRVQVGLDSGPPTLELDHVVLDRVVLPLGTTELTGRVADDSPCELSVGEQRVKVAEDGSFRVALEAGAARPLRLKVEDPLGQQALVDVVVYRSLAPLMDRKGWLRATPDERSAAIAEVEAIVGTDYRYRSTETFTCGGVSHPIAVFEHVRTGMLLHLLPGDETTIGNLDPEGSGSVGRQVLLYELYALVLGRLPLAKDAAREDFLRTQVEAQLRDGKPRSHPAWQKITRERVAGLKGEAPGAWPRSELPATRVRIPPLLVGRSEALIGEWTRVRPAPEQVSQQGLRPSQPAVWVSHSMVEEWLVEAGGGLRLPSEAEWEYAARAGTSGAYFWGSNNSHADRDYEGTYNAYWLSAAVKGVRGGQPMAVDDHPRLPNAFGLVDTLGNVWEMCSDAYFSTHGGRPKDHRPRTSESEAKTVRRGGGFNFGGPGNSTCSVRGRDDPGAVRWALGFRAVRGLLDE
jgi:serine/threonine protein kinase/formylglycine-generating enzyme required for sulfatase activity